ncbi:MAG: SCO family protein [Spirochaetales bacterium]|nr:SCO family protein [Spirochaetales bacterium]
MSAVKQGLLAGALLGLLAAFPWYGPHLGMVWQRPFAVEPFSLRNAETGKSFRYPDGRPYLLYFGFQTCRLACPIALAEMGAFLRQAGDSPACPLPVVLFASIDPRDTQKSLRGKSVFGEVYLLDGEDRVIDVARNLGYNYRLPSASLLEDPLMQIDHADSVFLLDSKGFVTQVVSPVQVDTLRSAWQRIYPACATLYRE